MEGERGFFEAPKMKEASREISPEVLEQIETEEAALRNEVLAATQPELLRRGIDKMPSWMIAGAFAAQLMGSETALARDRVEVRSIIPIAESNHEYPAMSESARNQLLGFLDQGAEIRVYPVARTSEEYIFSITRDEVLEGFPFVFDFPIDYIYIGRDFPEPSVADQKEMGSEEESKSFRVQYGEGLEMISIYPNERDDQAAKLDGHTLVRSDLSALNMNIDGAFYHRPAEQIGTVGEIPVMSGSENREEAKRELDRVDEDITKGIRNVHELFGFTDNVVTGISIAETEYRNAFASGTKIRFNDELLKRRSKSDEEMRGVDIKMTRYMIEETAEHETLHVMDTVFDIAANPDLQYVYSMSTPNTLDAYNEKRFSGTFGGHASENVSEFFASVVNGLDDPKWMEHTAALSEEGRTHYELTLKTIEKALEGAEKLSDDAPIFDLLDDRIAKLQAMAQD